MLQRFRVEGKGPTRLEPWVCGYLVYGRSLYLGIHGVMVSENHAGIWSSSLEGSLNFASHSFLFVA